jgi:putative endonuclease
VLRAVGVLRLAATDATTRELGALGEEAAAAHLRGRGFKVIGRNLRVPMGEADLLCTLEDVVVLVEVKTRLRREGAPLLSNTVAPEASVTAHKRRKLLSIAKHLKRANRWSRVRIDVVGVEYHDDGGDPEVRHHPGVGWV